MSAYLDGFEYDIFISYAWSGNEDTLVGDRAWAMEFRAELQENLRQILTDGRPVRIFLDTKEGKNGDVRENFKRDVEASALFLPLISPAFHREGCFCLEELKWFHESPRQISVSPVAPSDRFFRALIRPIADKSFPHQFPNAFSFIFYEGEPRADLTGTSLLPFGAYRGAAGSRLRESYLSLLDQLSRRLRAFKGLQATFPLRRVFVADTASARRDQYLYQLKPHEIVDAPTPHGLREEDFEARTVGVMQSCIASLHLVDPEGPPCTPPGWTRSVFQIQMEAAKAAPQQEFRRFVWWDERIPIADPAIASAVHQLRTYKQLTGTLDLILQSAEYMASNVKIALDQMNPAVASPVLAAAPQMKRVFVQCHPDDLDRIVAIQPALAKKNIDLQLPVHSDEEQDDLDQLFSVWMEENDVTLIYWGSRSAAAMALQRQRLYRLASKLPGQKVIVGVDPHSPVRTAQSVYRTVTAIPFPLNDLETAVENFRTEAP